MTLMAPGHSARPMVTIGWNGPDPLHHARANYGRAPRRACRSGHLIAVANSCLVLPAFAVGWPLVPRTTCSAPLSVPLLGDAHRKGCIPINRLSNPAQPSLNQVRVTLRHDAG